MQISSVNTPNNAFGGIFSTLLGMDRTNGKKPYQGKHFEKKGATSSLECNSNYNKHLVQKRTVQRPRIDAGQMLRLFESRVEPEVQYVIDSDSKIAVGEGKIFNLSSIQMRSHTNFLEDGDTLYIDPKLPTRKACGYDKSSSKIALTKIGRELYMLSVPKGIKDRVALLPNLEYIDSDEKFPVLLNGTKYAVQKNSVIEIDGKKVYLSDFDTDSLEDKDQIVITQAMLNNEFDNSKIGSKAPVAYITKSRDTLIFSLAPDSSGAIYCGLKTNPEVLKKAEPEVQEISFEDLKTDESPNLPEPVSYTYNHAAQNFQNSDIISSCPSNTGLERFVAGDDLIYLNDYKEKSPVSYETDLGDLSYTTDYSSYDTVFQDECIVKSSVDSPVDAETIAKFKKILSVVGIFLKGQEINPRGVYMGARDEDGVAHLVFGGYRNSLLSKINIIDLMPTDLDSAKLTSFNIDSIDRLPEDRAKMAYAFLECLRKQDDTGLKRITAFDGNALPMAE